VNVEFPVTRKAFSKIRLFFRILLRASRLTGQQQPQQQSQKEIHL
jgi:hypothetical protein